ncbi:MAG TPA: hypothetical protein VEA38_08640 [Terriglobales bacterium]|nr:hypothetical protein [Terriglobales bacterium]
MPHKRKKKALLAALAEAVTEHEAAVASTPVQNVQALPAPPPSAPATPSAPSAPVIPEAPAPPEAPGTARRYVGWVYDAGTGTWVGREGPSQPYKTIRLKTAPGGVGLLDAATGARYINLAGVAARIEAKRQANLPPTAAVASPDQRVANIVRIAASLVETPHVRVGPLATVRWGKEFTLPGATHLIDLTGILRDIAAGTCRPAEHGRSNEIHHNTERILANRTVDGYATAYREYGWLFPVPASMFTAQQGRPRIILFNPGAHANADLWRDRRDLTRGVVDAGNKLDVGLRLVISSRADVYFTADHYKTFYRYSVIGTNANDAATGPNAEAVGGMWTRYVSPELRLHLTAGRVARVDASWYHNVRPRDPHGARRW